MLSHKNWNQITGLKNHKKKHVDQQKKKLREKKTNTGSTKLPIPMATQLYYKRKVKLNSRKPVLRKRQNLFQSI
jgi:hypothetical protein